MTLPRYALVSFTHLDRHVKRGDQLELHDELVELRPDLFTTDPEEIAPKATKKEAQRGRIRQHQPHDPAGHSLDRDSAGSGGGDPGGDDHDPD